MGTCKLDEKEIADIFEEAEIESICQGDFSEEDFIKGAKIYLKRLRKQGAHIPKK